MNLRRKFFPTTMILASAIFVGFTAEASSKPAWWRLPYEQWPQFDYLVKIGGGDYNMPIWAYAELWKTQGFDCIGDNSPRNAVIASLNCVRTQGNSSTGFQIIFHHGPPDEFVVDSVVLDGQRQLTDVETRYFFHYFRRQIGAGNDYR